MSLHRWCRSSIFLCRRRWTTWRTPYGFWIVRSPSRSSKCPGSLAHRVLLVLLFLSRSQRNSWWKCRQSCLPRASLFRSRSRSSTLQFLVVVVKGVFKVFSQDRVQQRRLLRRNAFLSGLWSSFPFLLRNALLSGLRSSSWTLLLVWALDRDLPHLLVLQMRILLGVFALFPVGKKCACPRESECGAAAGCQLMDSSGLCGAQWFGGVG